MNDDDAIGALRAEFDREPGLRRANPEEIWVRARVDEILERDRPALRALGAVQFLTLDAAVAALAWMLLGAEPVVPLFGLALPKVLVAALAASVAHAAATLGGALSAAQG